MIGHIPVRSTPNRSVLTWIGSVLTGGAGLALAYGFHEPVIAERTIRILFTTSLALFVLSRLLMLVPFSGLGARLRRWWPDFVLLAAAGVWWGFDHSKEPLILRIAAVYSVAIGAAAVARTGTRALIEGLPRRTIGSAARRLFFGALILAVVGGAVLCLPVCWERAYPVSGDNTYPGQNRYELGVHGLNCLFTATAAVSGTGLAVLDIGHDFSRIGQIVILVLMQIGGLGILIVGAVVGWRFRQMLGWGNADDDASPAGLRRLIRFVCLATLLFEAAGAGLLFKMWDPSIDANFANNGDRLLASVFHAVSAFCNVGLSLPQDSLLAYRSHWAIYAAILPLMVLGSLGGPVLYDLSRSLVRGGKSLSTQSRVTLVATAVLIIIGAGLLFAIESTSRWQLRYPRGDTPGRLVLASTQPTTTATSPSSIISPDSQRLRTMTVRQRWTAALFHSVAARGGGMRTARLDESSISPASRMLLMVSMVPGGGLGGTTGGLRILILVLLAGTITLKAKKLRDTNYQPILIAAALASAMFVMIFLTTLTLVYRETGSQGVCVFEAISACCNVGLSAGLTAQLSIQGRIVIVLAMLLGRVVPLAILLRCLYLEPARTSQPSA